MSTYTEEFKAYCAAQGRAPDEQLTHDRAKYPGGCMCGFILWCSDMLAQFKAAHPEACIGTTIADHKAKVRFMRSKARI